MKWRDNNTHPEPLTECLCEYTNPNDGTRFYAPLIAYPEGTWITGSAILYNQYEITKWCPLDEIAEYLNKISNKEDEP